jgi:AraC-like DNA-binding protein
MIVSCPLLSLPEIDRAGEYPLLNSGFDFTYNQQSYSIHFYEYDGIIRLGNEEYTFQSGDVTLEAPEVTYAYLSDQPGRHWCIHFFWKGLGDTFSVNCYHKLGTDSLRILEQIKLISRLFNTSSGSVDKLEASFRLQALLLSLARLSRPKDHSRSSSNFHWAELTKLIDDNLKNYITTAWLAKKLNITSPTLAKKFKKQFGCTVAQYVLKKRIDTAKSLLTTSNMTINEVGSLVGIEDPQYFNKQFRKIVGQSPSLYRDKNKSYLVEPDRDIAVLGGSWISENKAGEN